jgi:hypothetical protein
MVDRTPIETVEDIRAAIFDLTNVTLTPERSFKQWRRAPSGRRAVHRSRV